MKGKFSSMAACSWCLLIVACEGTETTAATPRVSLRNDVMPIFDRHSCAVGGSCHSDPLNGTAHHTDFRTAESTYTSLIGHPSLQHCPADGSDAGIALPVTGEPRVTPGDPSQSFLVNKVRETREGCGIFHGRMPPPPLAPLTEPEIEVLVDWIAQGAHDN